MRRRKKKPGRVKFSLFLLQLFSRKMKNHACNAGVGGYLPKTVHFI